MKQVLETIQKEMTATDFLKSRGLDPKLFFVAVRNARQELVVLRPNQAVREDSELMAIPIISGG